MQCFCSRSWLDLLFLANASFLCVYFCFCCCFSQNWAYKIQFKNIRPFALLETLCQLPVIYRKKIKLSKTSKAVYNVATSFFVVVHWAPFCVYSMLQQYWTSHSFAITLFISCPQAFANAAFCLDCCPLLCFLGQLSDFIYGVSSHTQVPPD